jgi:uncharacterized protein (DUF58 family)
MKIPLQLNRLRCGLQSASRTGNHDFCPGLNQYVYWLKQPIGWFTSAGLVALLLGLFGESAAFGVAGAIFGLVLLGIAWPAWAVRCVSAKLHWRKSRCEEGESLETILDVVNRYPWSVWGLIVESDEAIVNGGAEQKESVSLASVPAISKSRFVWQATPQKRGEYPQRTASLTSGFPFGLWMARRPLLVEQSILVWPKTVDLGDLPALNGRERSVVGAWIDRAGSEGDVIGVRPYREGDSLRHVHWAQSARHDSLVVCERQSVARRSLRLELFPVVDESLSTRKEEVQEWLVRVGGSVARTFLSHHWSVQLKVEEAGINAEPGPQAVNHMLDGLARLQWSSVSNEPGAMASQTGILPSVSYGQSRSGRIGATNDSLSKGDVFSLGIADVANYKRFSDSREYKSFRWIIIDQPSELMSSLSSAANLWFSVNLEQSVWPQLLRHWSGVCRNASTYSSKASNVCVCDS